jgi:hypothetical protein
MDLQTININPITDAIVGEKSFFEDADQASPFSADTVVPEPVLSGEPTPEAPPEAVAPLPEAPPAPEAPQSLEDQKKALDGVNRFLFLRKTITSLLFAFWINDIGKMKMFSTTQDENNALYDVYKEYAHLFGGTPKYLDLIAVECMILIPKITLAMQMKKQNAIVAQTPQSEVVQNQTPVTNVDRKFFIVDENGYYTYQPLVRTYVKKENRNERANVDLHYNELVAANGPETIKNIFGV